ncbi:hypothetical protein [Glutamicibacter creatinolyticus]|uniref:hypothetical protein n=1 Tax=Glutamicibacter creatinolyticus TaxID=162496 RepID=UPI003B986A37
MIAKVASLKSRHAERRSDVETLAEVFSMPLRNPGRTLLCFIIVFCLGSAFYLMQPAKYSAQVDVVVVAVTSSSQVAADRDVSIDSAVQILYSDAVVGKTARELEYPGRSSGLLRELAISPIINSRILRLYVSNTDPQLAYRAVKLLSANFLEERLTRLESLEESRREELQAHIKVLRTEAQEQQIEDIPISERREALAESSEQISELEFALSAIDTIPPDPGFISRQAAVPDTAARPPVTVYFTSSLALAIVLSFIVAPNRRSALSDARFAARASRPQLLGGINV